MAPTSPSCLHSFQPHVNWAPLLGRALSQKGVIKINKEVCLSSGSSLSSGGSSPIKGWLWRGKDADRKSYVGAERQAPRWPVRATEGPSADFRRATAIVGAHLAGKGLNVARGACARVCGVFSGCLRLCAAWRALSDQGQGNFRSVGARLSTPVLGQVCGQRLISLQTHDS